MPITMSAAQADIIAADSKKIEWLFFVQDSNNVNYFWSTQYLTVADVSTPVVVSSGQTVGSGVWLYGTNLQNNDFEFKVIGFDGVETRHSGDGHTLIAPTDTTFVVENDDQSLTATDFDGGYVVISLRMTDVSTGIAQIVRRFRFYIKHAVEQNKTIHFYCEDYITKYIQGQKWPKRPRLGDQFYEDQMAVGQAVGVDFEMDDERCVPYLVGQNCVIPLTSIWDNSNLQRYYVMGSGGTSYTITEMYSPVGYQNESVWTQAGYTFTQVNLTGRSSGTYKAVDPIVLDADGDGTADTSGLFKTGSSYVEATFKYHSDESTPLANPATCIHAMLLEMGVPNTRIVDQTFIDSSALFDANNLAFSGGWFRKVDATKALSDVLIQANSGLVIEDGISLYVHSKTSVKTITKADILRSGLSDAGSFQIENEAIDYDQYDGGYYEIGESFRYDKPKRLSVPVEGANQYATNPSESIIDMKLVSTHANAAKMARMYYQRKIGRFATVAFRTKATCLDILPGDVITIDDPKYGGTYDIIVDSVKINKDVSLDIYGYKFKYTLEDLGDVPAVAPTITVGGTLSANVVQPIYSGPNSTVSSGVQPNTLPGNLKLSNSTTDYILLDPVGATTGPSVRIFKSGTEYIRLGELNGMTGYAASEFGLAINITATSYIRVDPTNGIQIGFDTTGTGAALTVMEGAVTRLIIGKVAAGEYGILGNNAAGNEVFKIDTSGANIAGWAFTTTALTSANITIDSGNDRIVVDGITIDGANNRIRSSNYVSGTAGSGFTLEPGLLEVGNIACRGIFRTAVFQYDVISAVGGEVWVTRGADVLSTDMTALDASTMTIEGNVTFAVNDRLRMKDGADDETFLVTNIGAAPTYTVTRDTGGNYAADNNPAWTKGSTVVNLGQSGDGYVILKSSSSGVAYMTTGTSSGSPPSYTGELRLGNLNGFYDYASDLFGIFIGKTGANNPNMTYDTTNGLRLRMNTTTLMQFDVAGSANIAGWTINSTTLANSTNIILDASNSAISIKSATWQNDGIQLQYNAGNPRMYVGDGVSKYIQFDGTDVTIGPQVSFGINSATWQNDGIQLQYNAGNPRFYCGDGSNNYFQFDGTSVSISSSSTSALVIKSGGDVTLESGGDLILESAAGGNAAFIEFTGNSRTFYMGTDYTNERLHLYTDTDGQGGFNIGQNFSSVDKRFSTVGFYAADAFSVSVFQSADQGFFQVLDTSAVLTLTDTTRTVGLSLSPSTTHLYAQLKAAGGDSDIWLYNGASNYISMTSGYVQINCTVFTHNLQPIADSTYALGENVTPRCWTNLYIDAGPTSCSDRNYKKNISQETLGLDFVNALVPITYEWDQAKGKNLKGTFHGVLAQEVEQALIDVGVDPGKFAGVDKTTQDDGKLWYGFMYDQLLGPMVKAIQEMDAENKLLKSEVTALELRVETLEGK